jgi:hypothetical protein
MVRFYPQP